MAEKDIDLKIEKKKKKFSKSWKPARILHIPEDLLDPNFVYRDCTTNKEGNINKKLAEGWEIDTEIAKKMKARGLTYGTVDDGTQIDGVLKRREMILMRMPKEIAQQRKEYYDKMTDLQERKGEDDFRSTAPAYGSIKRSVN